MLNRYFIIIIIMILVPRTYAGLRIYAGGTVSTLNTSESYYRNGKTVGLDKTWEYEQACLSFGLQYIIRASYLKNKTMVFLYSDQGYYFDALFSVSYLEFPLLCTFDIIKVKAIKFRLNFGSSLAISLKDYSKTVDSQHFSFENDPSYRSTHTNNYVEYDDPNPLYFQSNSAIGLNVGFVVKYRSIFCETRYSHLLNGLDIVKGLNMKGEKYRTIEFLFGVHISGLNKHK